MDHCTMGAALKRKGISQKQVIETLRAKYGLNISQANFNEYSRKWNYKDSETWRVIRECLQKEFGIVYEPTHWD